MRVLLTSVVVAAGLAGSARRVDRPHVFDDGGCAALEQALDARGSPLQRAEVAGRWALDAALFRRLSVAAYMRGYTSSLRVLLDTLAEERAERGAEAIRLRFEGVRLTTCEREWLSHRWPDKLGARRYARELAEPTLKTCREVPATRLVRAAFQGVWRVRPATMAAVHAQQRAVHALLDEAVASAGTSAQQTLEAVRGAISFHEAAYSQSLLLREDGRTVLEVASQGAWTTVECGRWQVVGGAILLWHALAGTGEPVANSFLPEGDALRLGGGRACSTTVAEPARAG